MSAKDNAVAQAQTWAQEARVQKETVRSILRYFGLPEHDWEALSLIKAKLEQPADDQQQGQLERSHIAQWCELTLRAANFGLALHFEWNCFRVQARATAPPYAWTDLKECRTLHEVRAAISDHVLGRRQGGEPT